MNTKIFFIAILCLIFAASTFAQQPPRPQKQGPPNGRGGEGRDRPDGKGGDWIRPNDTNQNGILDTGEFQAAVDRTFADLDKNSNGTLEVQELRQARGRLRGRDQSRGLEIRRHSNRVRAMVKECCPHSFLWTGSTVTRRSRKLNSKP